MKWVRLSSRDQAAEAPVWSLGGFCRKAPERKRWFERVIRPRRRSKALKGEAHECWRLKKVSKGSGGEHHREGSQTLRVGLSEIMATISERFSQGKW